MTQIGELAMVGALDEASDDKCPFCYKKRHDFASRKKKATAKVTSKPNQLACAKLAVKGSWSHTTAKHHLISAIQCYAKVRRLVRMASMVNYDINDPPNGIGLPTVANNIVYTVGGVGPQKFGKFAEPEKRNIAFSVMTQAKAQWHVGHHAFDIDIPPDWADEEDGDIRGHTVSYDESVIKKLLKIMDAWVEAEICAEEDDKSSTLKADMDALSKLIKDKLEMFAQDMPRSSAPFYVSRLSFDFAGEADKKRDLDDDDQPPKRKAKR